QPPAQEMKSTRADRLLEAWEKILGTLGGPSSAREAGAAPGLERAAVFDTQGEVLRTFARVEEEARDFERNLLCKFRDGAVIPLSHSYGFSNLLTPLLVRGVPMVLSRDRMPRAVLNDLARTNATVFPGMPVFYQAFSEMEDVPEFPKLRLCISAGAPLSLEV